MIRWPVSCIVQVWAYSDTKPSTSTPKYNSASDPRPSRSPVAMCWSIATFIR